MPDLETILEHSKGDTYEEYLIYLNWHQALSSEAYLLHSSEDPLEAAISAGKDIQKSRSMQPHHLRDDFDVLLEHLDQFVTKLVGHSSSEEEISRLLWNETGVCNKVGVLPQRLHDFLDLSYKQVSLFGSRTLIICQMKIEFESKEVK